MAQTISIVRGSTTITNNSTGTLFTNGSSGNGTRVIVVQLFYSGTNNASGNRQTGGILLINGSGVGETPIGITGSGGYRVSSIGPALSASIPQGPVFSSTGNIGAVLTGLPGMTTSGIAYSPVTGSNEPSSMVPQTFWIGPSDAVRTKPIGFREVSGKSTTDASVTVRYSFILITES